MKPVVFHLVGPPASGKRTVGLQLAALTGAVLLDNHLFNDVVFKPYGANGLRTIPPEVVGMVSEVRRIGLRAATLAPRDVHQVFTSYLSTRASGAAALQLMRDLAAARDATFIPVWLECDLPELERRLALPGRLERAKLRDPEKLRLTLQERGVMNPPPDAIRVNSAALTPGEAARLIASHSGFWFQ